jgi:hypothetical protein
MLSSSSLTIIVLNFRLSWWLIIDIDSIPQSLHCVCGSVADVSERHAASISRVKVSRLRQLTSFLILPWRWRQHVLLKCWQHFISAHWLILHRPWRWRQHLCPKCWKHCISVYRLNLHQSWRWRHHVPLKHWHHCPHMHNIKTQDYNRL